MDVDAMVHIWGLRRDMDCSSIRKGDQRTDGRMYGQTDACMQRRTYVRTLSVSLLLDKFGFERPNFPLESPPRCPASMQQPCSPSAPMYDCAPMYRSNGYFGHSNLNHVSNNHNDYSNFGWMDGCLHIGACIPKRI
eukprot:365443-Chlamydomonas_euryale.AAC.32